MRRVTVMPRGQALGVTLSVPDDDRYNYSEAYLRARIVSALGGRAAEQIVYGEVTTGAENDLKQVTDLARAMVTRWGMSQEVGLLSLSGREDGNFLEHRPGSGRVAPLQRGDRAGDRRGDQAHRRRELCHRPRPPDAQPPAPGGAHRALLREESLNEAQMRAAAGLDERRERDAANVMAA